jgi:hypothetical protein
MREFAIRQALGASRTRLRNRCAKVQLARFLHADKIKTPTLSLGGEKDFSVSAPRGAGARRHRWRVELEGISPPGHICLRGSEPISDNIQTIRATADYSVADASTTVHSIVERVLRRIVSRCLAASRLISPDPLRD